MKDFPGDARTVGADLNAALRPRHEEPLPWAPLASSSYPSLTRRERAAPFLGHALCTWSPETPVPNSPQPTSRACLGYFPRPILLRVTADCTAGVCTPRPEGWLCEDV